MAAQKLKTLEEMTGLSFGGAKKKSDLNDILKQNAKSRVRIAEVGEDDPTKKRGPSALERIFGPLDVLGTGVRGLVHNAVDDKEDVDVWQEMAKALKGEERVEGADILGHLGVENKWGKMLGGFAVDVLLDPITYLTFGFGSGAKASGRGLLTAITKYGDDAARIVEATKMKPDDVARGLSALKDAGLLDKLTDIARGGNDARALSQEVMRTLYGTFGKGGVKFAGIPLGGEKAVSKLGYAAKAGARAVPGSRWLEQAFGLGAMSDEAVDLFREGNEVTNALVKALRSNVSGNIKASEAFAARFGKELESAIPDKATREWASIAFGRTFGDEAAALADKVDAWRLVKDDPIEAAKAMDDLVAFRGTVIGKAKGSVEDTLRNVAKLPEEQVQQALAGIDAYYGTMQKFYEKQKALGLLDIGLFGDDAAGYLPGLPGAASDDVLKGIGAGNLREQTHEPSGFFAKSLKEQATGRKEFLTPEARMLGVTREGEKADALLTELDISKLGTAAAAKQGRNIAIREFRDDLSKTFGDDSFAEKMAASVEKVFTDDEATKNALRVLDKVTNAWKRQATVLRFPAFQSRNFLSNKILMWQDNGLSALGEEKSLSLIGKMLSGKLDDAGVKMLDEMAEDGVLTSFRELSEQVGKGGGTKVTKWLGEVNTVIENQSRMSAYFTYLKQGMGRQAAGEMVNKALFNYSDEALSVFERHFVKRLVPFYKWMKNNLSKQTRLLFESPGKTAWLGHLKQSGEAVTEYDKSVTPDWLRDVFPIPLPTEGETTMLSTAGLFPQGDLELLSGLLGGKFDPKDAFGSLSPILRTPLELLFNKDLWYDSEIEKYAGERKRVPASIEIASDAIMGVPGIGDVWQKVLKQVGVESREEEGEQYLAASAKSLKLLRDWMPWLNQVNKMLGDAEGVGQARLMGLTGIKTIPFSTERFARNQAYEDRASLNDVIQRLKDEGRIPEQQPKASLADLFGGGR